MQRSSFEEIARYYTQKKPLVPLHRFSQPKRPSRSGFLILLFVILILILLAGLAGFLIFGRQVLEFKTEGVLLKVGGVDQLVVGQKETFVIRVKNKERTELRAAELTLGFPQGFYFENSSEPCVEKLVAGCVWPIGKLLPAEEKIIEFEGYFLSPILPDGEKNKFTVSLNFQIAGFTANFRKTIERTIEVGPSLSIEINHDKEIFLGQETRWEIVIENKGKNDLKEIEVGFDHSVDFNVSFLASPDETIDLGTRTEKGQTWKIKELQVGGKKSIILRGLFNEAGERTIKARAGLIGPTKRLLPQVEIEKKIIVNESNFNLEFLDETNLLAEWGKELSLVFTYQNSGQQDLEDVFLKLTIGRPEYLNWLNTFRGNWQWQSGEKRMATNLWQVSEDDQNKILTWQAAQIPALKKIGPGETGQIKFNLKIIPLLEAIKHSYTKADLDINLEVSGSWQEGARFFLKAKPLQIKIKTSFIPLAEARYYDDERLAVGQGPVPPRVGERTVYRIYFNLKNTTNPIQEIEMRTNLPSNLKWAEGKFTSVGDIKFNQQTRTVIWQINRLDQYSGGSYSLIEASFLLALTPKEEDRGQILFLTGPIQLSATDGFTGQKIFQELSPLDTNLSGDPVVTGRGRVE